MIHFSEAAANEIKRLQSSRQKPDSKFRLGVKNGGCSGLFYTLELSEGETPQSSNDSDRYFESNGISVVIDALSYKYLKGLKLDYSEDLMGGSFRFHNPNAFATCGCGQSFSVDS